MRSTWLSSVAAALLLAAVLPSTPAFAAADAACQPLFDSTAKLFATSAHVYNTTLAGGKSRTGELIYANGAIYVLVNGKWTRSRMTTQDMLKQEQENIRNSTTTCRHVRDELVNGEAATLYTEQAENQGIKSNGQIWISKSRGVPLRTEQDVDTGDADKQHMSIRYDYSNVHPPAGVQ
jgi:outer membrane lipoprotein-sorting protein